MPHFRCDVFDWGKEILKVKSEHESRTSKSLDYIREQIMTRMCYHNKSYTTKRNSSVCWIWFNCNWLHWGILVFFWASDFFVLNNIILKVSTLVDFHIFLVLNWRPILIFILNTDCHQSVQNDKTNGETHYGNILLLDILTEVIELS